MKKYKLPIVPMVISIFLLASLARKHNFINWKKLIANQIQNTQKNYEANFDSATSGLILKNENRANYHSQINHNDYSIPIITNAQTVLPKKIEVDAVSRYKSLDRNMVRTNIKDDVDLN